MIDTKLLYPDNKVGDHFPWRHLLIIWGRLVSRALLLAGLALLIYGLVWNYSTRRYLKGFSDAIVPLEGTAEEKSEALLGWLREEPDRRKTPINGSDSRDPVGIVQDARLLKICGSASNAFINLAVIAGLRTRRLLLLDASGVTNHVVVEVKWDERWVVVDPSFRAVFRDDFGRALTSEELRSPEMFQEATSRIPKYDPKFRFDKTVHIRLERIPIVGSLLRRVLNFLLPRWEEQVNWGYFPENPSIWPILTSVLLFPLAIFIRLIVFRYDRRQLGVDPPGLRKRLMESGRVFLQRSA